MNYNDIAELVHNAIKNPQESSLPSVQMNTHEGAVIEKVLSEFKASEDTMAFGSIPLFFW